MRDGRAPRRGYGLLTVLVAIAILLIAAAVLLPNALMVDTRLRLDRADRVFDYVGTAIADFEGDVGECAANLDQLNDQIQIGDPTLTGDTYSFIDVFQWDGPYLPRLVPPSGLPTGIGTLTTFSLGAAGGTDLRIDSERYDGAALDRRYDDGDGGGAGRVRWGTEQPDGTLPLRFEIVFPTCGAAGPGLAVGETGTVAPFQFFAGQWFTVNLNNSYTNPIVVMGPASYADADPLTIRVRNVTATSFEYQIDEWDYLSGGFFGGFHPTETIHYMVMEAGTHTLDDGTVIEAGSANVGNPWSTVPLTAFGSTPVVLSQVTTTNEGSAVTTRQRNVASTGFQVQLEEEEAAGAHATETVHWIAVQQTITPLLEAAVTPNAVTQNWYAIGFGGSWAAPVFLADMQTTDGGDPAVLRYRNLTATGVEVFVEEEQSNDTETNHITEAVGYVVFDAAGNLIQQ
jgi:type II secretory pathway pseudopilin PulG